MNISLIYFIIAFIIMTAFIYVVSYFVRGKQNHKFDERQLLVRGNAFKYGFFTVIIGLTVQIIITMTVEDAKKLFYPSAILILAAGICVYAVYAIWNDAYIGINEKSKSYIVSDAIVAIANILIGISNISNGTTEEASGYVPGLVNLVLGGVFVIMFITMLLKKLRDKRED